MLPTADMRFRVIRSEANYVLVRVLESKPGLIEDSDGERISDHPVGIALKIRTAGYEDPEFQEAVGEHFGNASPGSLFEATVEGHIGRIDAAARLAEFRPLSEKRLAIDSADTSDVEVLQNCLKNAGFNDNSVGRTEIVDGEEVLAEVEFEPVDNRDLQAVVSGGSDWFENKFQSELSGNPITDVLFINMRDSRYAATIRTPYHGVGKDLWEEYRESATAPNLHEFKLEMDQDNFKLRDDGFGKLIENPPLSEADSVKSHRIVKDSSGGGGNAKEQQNQSADDESADTPSVNAHHIDADSFEEAISNAGGDLTYAWQSNSDVQLSDYGGRPDLRKTINENIVVPFRDQPEKADRFNISIPSVLLYGPPGTGKTYLAEALAGELGYPFVTLSGGDILSRWVNASAGKIKTLFDEAEYLAAACGGAMIFIDEIDSVLTNRQAGNQHQEDQKAVNEFLTYIEGLGDENILFIGATNIYDELDPAAVSRFDRTIHVGLPDARTRKEIFEVQLSDRPHSVNEKQFRKLASGTEGLTARDIATIVTDAARHAAFKTQRDKVLYKDCRRAVLKFRQT
ncbi:ATP-binding protein [Halobacterium salinarum]|uniref:ATP-binding protein n=1 Tax=Halobacterium salinarum TaxID=2242 RepID=UPI0025536F33|nr:ATP-binding protein [Halobacterium salinarum]MDL0128511.1 ATP-binding protein [Halobacterium salinarum]